ncbi:hypothetical protein AB0H49_33860 [Nocardia sp. NPDC050713]|uniref:hypothetical protein n=1 Tax=Nocardia sp. NPDC050713 TaxID=3154511 RepID=UPI0033E4BED3
MSDNRESVWMLDGRVADLARLYRTRHGWAHPSPQACPAGHRLGPDQVIVSAIPCGHLLTHHRSYTCRTCGRVVAWPPITQACNHFGGLRNL